MATQWKVIATPVVKFEVAAGDVVAEPRLEVLSTWRASGRCRWAAE
ncbi:MAG: hypothetical protein R3E96_03885 [Planctomycetota bacterium]